MIEGLLAATLAVTLASAVQAVTGSGFGLVAAPLLLLVDQQWVPGPLLAVTLVMMGLAMWQDREGLRGPGRRMPDLGLPALSGAVGAAAAVPLVALVATAWLAPAVGALVVIVAGGTLLGLRVSDSRLALGLAGATGGVLATVAAMPGPPVVIAYRCPDPRRMRANLALYFLVTCSCSAVVLAVAGRLPLSDVRLSMALVPGTTAGLALGVWIRGRLPSRCVRPMGLWLAMAAGGALLIHTVPGVR